MEASETGKFRNLETKVVKKAEKIVFRSFVLFRSIVI